MEVLGYLSRFPASCLPHHDRCRMVFQQVQDFLQVGVHRQCPALLCQAQPLVPVMVLASPSASEKDGMHGDSMHLAWETLQGDSCDRHQHCQAHGLWMGGALPLSVSRSAAKDRPNAVAFCDPGRLNPDIGSPG